MKGCFTDPKHLSTVSLSSQHYKSAKRVISWTFSISSGVSRLIGSCFLASLSTGTKLEFPLILTMGWRDRVFYKQLADVSHYPLFLWDTLTCWMSARNSTQWRGGCLGGSWSVWSTNFLTHLVSEPTRGPARPAVYEESRAGGRCDDQRPSWALWPRNYKVFDSWWSKEKGQQNLP